MYRCVNTMVPMRTEGAQQGAEVQAQQVPHALSCLTSLPITAAAEDMESSAFSMPQQLQTQQQSWCLHQARQWPPSYTSTHRAAQHNPALSAAQELGMEDTDNVVAKAENSGQHTVREFIKHLAALNVGQQGIKRRAEHLDQDKSTADTCQQPAAEACEELPCQHSHAASSDSSGHDSQGGEGDVEGEGEGEGEADEDEVDEDEEDEEEAEEEEEGLATLELPADVLEQLLRAMLRLLQSADCQLQQRQVASQCEAAPSQQAALLRLSSQLLQHCTWLAHLPSLPLTTSRLQMRDLLQGQSEGLCASQVHESVVVASSLREPEDVSHWLARLEARPVVTGQAAVVDGQQHQAENEEQEREHTAGQLEEQQVAMQGVVNQCAQQQQHEQEAVGQQDSGQQQQQQQRQLQGQQVKEQVQLPQATTLQQQRQDTQCSLLLLQEHQVHITQDHVKCTQQVVVRTVCWLFPPGSHPKVRSGSGAWIARKAHITPVGMTAVGNGSSSSTSLHSPATASGSLPPRLGRPPASTLLAAHQQKVREQQETAQQTAESQASHSQNGGSSPHDCELLLQLRPVERDTLARLITEQVQLHAQLQLPRPPNMMTWLPELLEVADSLETAVTCLRTRILPVIAQTQASKQALLNTAALPHPSWGGTHRQSKQLQADEEVKGGEQSGQHDSVDPSLMQGVEGTSTAHRQAVLAAEPNNLLAGSDVDTERASSRRRLMRDAG